MNQALNGHCQMCDSMLHLTAQESSYHLHVGLLDELKKMSSVVRVSAFEARSNGHGDGDEAVVLIPYADQAEHDMDLMLRNTRFQACLNECSSQQFFDGEHGWCFIPVKRKTLLPDIWVVEFSGAVDECSIAGIELLVKVYQNCDAHISSHKHDSLTGLENRKALSERLTRILQGKEVARRRSEEMPGMASLCVLDIDFFKRVNDDFGHLYGDEVLLLFAGLMKKSFREYDFLYRYGGEEFVVLFETNSKDETTFVLERFRKAVDEYDFPQVGHVTVSVGFTQLKSGVLPSTLFDEADKALYYAKEHGRNQVCSYQKLLEAGLVSDERVDIESELF